MFQANAGRIKIVRFNNPLLILVLLPLALVALFVLAVIMLGSAVLPKRKKVQSRAPVSPAKFESKAVVTKGDVIDAEYEDITRA